MDYFRDAFGGFDSLSDQDAALKLSLNSLLADHRTDELLSLISDPKLGGVEGVPGWIIERRNSDEEYGYTGWPAGARYRAYVEPEGYELAHPEFFCDRPTFNRYARAIALVYWGRFPEKASICEQLYEALSRTSA